jgi:membrane-bound lytic murein transglycosylase D
VLEERLRALPHIIPMDYNNLVENSINLYTEKRRSLVRYMLGMADFYFPVMEPILEQYNLPLELKYLAVVESALNPTALSRAGAGGLWQFMLNTGKIYGLEINSLVDERRDPVKSTEAACRYLKDMYDLYGDWYLAIASYNCGPGNINKAIRRSGGKTSFWQIYRYLPRETRSYVPLYIAACYVMNYYCDHNICPVETTLPLATDTVVLNRNITLQEVAAVLNLDVEQLRALNPQYRRDIVPGYVEPSVLKLPASATYAFVDYQDSLFGADARAAASSRQKITHIVKSGETALTIANLYGVTAKQVRSWNGLRSNRIPAGRKLNITVDNGGVAFAAAKEAPKTSPKTTTAQTTRRAVQNTASASGSTTYTVKSGDSLYAIAKKYPGVTVAEIRDANNLSGNKIKPGQKLKIPRG